MAYFLSGSVIIDDGRELIGISTAGINTALFVGSDIQMDGASGIITAQEYYGDGSNLTGVGLTNTNDYEIRNLQAGIITATRFVGSGASLTDIPGLSWIETSGVPTERPNGDALQDGDIYYDTVGLRQYTYYSGDGGNWRDSNPAANSALSVTVGVETALVVPGADTLTLEASPATGEVVIGINTLTDTVTFGLDDDLVVGTSLNVGAGVSILGTTTIVDGEGEQIANSGVIVADGQNLLTPETPNGDPILFIGDGRFLTNTGVGPDESVETSGDIQAGIITATVQFDASGPGVGLTVTNDAFIGGNLEIGAGNSITAPFFYGDGSGLTGVGLEADSDIITTGDIQAGIITATTSLEATTGSGAGTGVGLTVTSDAWIGGNVTVVGDLEANDVNTTSDVTKKENIQVIGEALSKLKELKGVTFDWKATGESSGGIIAQDVEKVLPTLVKEGDDHKTVIYNGIVGLLVQAVKELSAEVDELKHS